MNHLPFLLSIIIPSRSTWQCLEATVLSCCQQQTAFDFEVIVVLDPLSPLLKTKRDLKFLESNMIPIKFVECARVGVGACRNLGAKIANAPLLYFLDDDCEIPNNQHLDQFIKWIGQNPQFDGFGSHYQSSPHAKILPRAYNRLCEAWLRRHHRHYMIDSPVCHLLGGNSIYKKNIFLSGFWFSENIAYGGSETEFNHRLATHGFQLTFTSKFPVIHQPQLTLKTFLLKAYFQGVTKGQMGLPRARARARARSVDRDTDDGLGKPSKKGLSMDSISTPILFSIVLYLLMVHLGTITGRLHRLRHHS